MRRLWPLAALSLTSLAIVACDSGASAPAPSATASSSAASSTASSTTTSAAQTAAAQTAAAQTAAAKPPERKKRKMPKAYAFANEIGTLPDGVGIAVGEKAPDFELNTPEGKAVKLAGLRKETEVLLVFYRGGW